MQWRAGFFKSVTISHPNEEWYSTGDGGGDGDGDDDGDHMYASHDIPKLLGQTLDSPAARFLAELRIGLTQQADEGRCDFAKVIKKLATYDLSRLRALYLGDISREQMENSWISVGNIAKLYPQLANLRSLTIRSGHKLTLGTIELPQLRELTIVTGGLDKKNIASICAAKWPKLHKLELWLGTPTYRGNVTLKDLKPLLEGKPFPKLTNLGLRNCAFADELAGALGSAKIVAQLNKLDLSKGTMSDAGVEAMIAAKDTFSHLEHLDLSDNFLAKSSRTASKIIPSVRTKPQRQGYESDGEIRRYVALGE